ncbi:MAG: cyclic beta 1-2 glucan synthetase [Gammaproteobacteria bacterium]|nr:cyclic beta 1-2 glucan synthetase [Gammaproteobacteria bacterium]
MLRAELFSIEQLKRHAVSLAGQHEIDPRPGADRLLARLADNGRVLLAAYELVSAAVTAGQAIAPAEAWLLDNFYLIEQQISRARQDLPPGYSRQLPRLIHGPSAGSPRIYDLALELISHMDGRVDSENTHQFIAAYQSIEPLQLGELWAFPIMLRLALLENLRRVGRRIAKRREERDEALIWAERLLDMAEKEPKQLIHLLAAFADADLPLSAAFVEEFSARLQTQGQALAFVQTWVEQKLAEQGVSATQLLEAAGRSAATNQISIANSIGSLRFIGAMDWKDYVESLSLVEQTLREDPAGMHAGQDFASRDRYRHVIEELAQGCRHKACSEPAVARVAIQLAQAAAMAQGAGDRRAHVGYYLIDAGRAQLEQQLGCRVSLPVRLRRLGRAFALPLYLGAILLLSGLVSWAALQSAFGGFSPTDWRYGLVAVTSLIGGSALAVALVNLLLSLLLPPHALPRLDFSQGIPDEQRSLVVVPTLLACAEDVDALIEALEIRYLGNRDPNLFFALMTDFHDAAEQCLPGEDALLAYAQAAVQALNQRYQDDRPEIFLLLHRARSWNPVEGVWMGHERKRGKLEQLNALLRGEGQGAFVGPVADPAWLGSIRYVITLDTDTQLPRDSACKLIGNLAHPLNRPVFSAALGRIVQGYGILQPRASISLASAGQSRFSRLFAGDAGLDPYTREVSDLYQDVFAEGSFIGKGIYDVDAFRQVLAGRFPDNLILSHDLLEGGYARSALVSDVDLIEEHPASYTSEASRRHRWIRGDWQLAGWLLPWVPGRAEAGRQRNPLSALSRWKLLDNLRRSLLAPALLVLLVGGWLWGPGPAGLWLGLVVAVLFLPSLVTGLIGLLRKPLERDWLVHLNMTARAAARPLMLALLGLILLPYDALICLDAIRQSGLRMLMGRRGLLLWHSKVYARRNGSRSLSSFWREIWIGPLLASALLLWLWQNGAEGFRSEFWPEFWQLPVLLLWLASPLVAWWISKPLLSPTADLSTEQRAFLRSCARRTWRYFADFVTAEDNWLPPDNVQDSRDQKHPASAIASRTSPTNIGMSLLADLAAQDFGYISSTELLQRLGRSLGSMEKLQRYRGHFFNWYDTRSLQPLHPQYVSSVDSGNLLGCLLTLQAGLAELKQQPLLSSAAFAGLRDTLQVWLEQPPATPPAGLGQGLDQGLDLLRTSLDVLLAEEQPLTLAKAHAELVKLQRVSAELILTLTALAALAADKPGGGEALYWARAFEHQARVLRDELQSLLPQADDLSPIPSPIPSLAELAQREAPGAKGGDRARAQLACIDTLIQRCQRLAEMDFEFLYDSGRGLLSIGYDLDQRHRDPACYDLLASEARLASFLLIAQGQVPQKHWFNLGRLLTRHGGTLSLISWSGSMFEYLMPQLIMPSYPNTLLEQTCKAAVARQIEYGRQRGVPWGISESCYNATDMHQVYQYRAFGVPGLGFKRGLGDDLVIAPYASALALMVLPEQACANLQRLAQQGVLGAYGFFEAIDYTPSRLPRGTSRALVRSFMSHHQGMSLLAFAQLLLQRPMQRRFLADAQVRATELLLQERVPKQGATLHPHAAEVQATARPPLADAGSIMRLFGEPNTAIPEVHLLSNGRYHLMATQAGGGYSRWRDLAITRWREDATCDNWGTFIYLRDRDSGRYWSSAHQPTGRKADHYEAIFVQGRAEYRRRDQAIEAHTEISVSPEDDVEIRRIKLTNQSSRARHIEVTSYAEVVLAPLNSDLAHRAFSNLFVQTEILAERQAILCTRRQRTPEESVPWMFHLLAAPGAGDGETSFETDRARFIGRNRSPANPLALEGGEASALLSNTQGPVLDPIVAIRRSLRLQPDESACLQIISGVADTRAAALALLDKYCDRHFVERAFEMAWFQSQEVLRHLGASEADAQVYGRLAGSVIYANALHRAAPGVIGRNRLGQAGLWKFAISGDLPIVLLRIGDLNRIDLVKQTLQAHAYWRIKGLAVDLVILNEDFSGYRAVLHDLITGLINTGGEAQLSDRPGGVFLRRAEELSEEDRVLLQTVASVQIGDGVTNLLEQVERRLPITRLPRPLQAKPPAVTDPIYPPVYPLAPRERVFCNGLGGFTPDGHEYLITLEPGQHTPAPWVNVIASPHIGTVVSESGSAYTWVENAHEFRLTHWHNDPISDSSGEAIYLRDEDSAAFWSLTPQPAPGRSGYLCRHGFGYSVFEHYEAGIASELFTYVAMDAPVKFLVVKLRNRSQRARSLSLTGYWELVLGEWRHANLMHIVTSVDPHNGALLAHNAYGRECANRVVFAQVSTTQRSLTGNRTEFIGRNGSLASPAALRREQLSGRTGAGLDPCAAIQARVELGAGQEQEIVFVFGAAAHTDQARQFIDQYSGPAGARLALEAVWAHWNRTLGAVNLDTPDQALNLLANGWLVYQTLSCRLWGRSGHYQSGGAYGFRDQLQDSMALVHATPWLAREQLLRCAGRQFLQGDVQHWWHPPKGQGVRTHFSDDYLWLAYATCRYVQTTGDTGVLDEPVAFLEGRALYPQEEAYYDQPQVSAEVASLYEHCVRAIKHGLRFGVHGLPLMGCGDWNDGMNRVGPKGQGESVWLAWFLYENLQLFAALAATRGDAAFAELCREQAAELRGKIEEQAWDGGWYKRAWFDDGTPLGSASNAECQIDSISQSWAVISGGGDRLRARQAMAAVDQRLVRREQQIIQLLDPPFDHSELEPGYIKGYIPGVRENGGQYSHAAIWASMAFALLGDKERAWELFALLNPIHHASTAEAMQRYRVEPYVMCADIYAAEPHVGRGGWTWYTGAAGWMYRLTLETLLGLHLEVDHLRIAPCIPAHWPAYKIHYRYRDTLYHISIKNAPGGSSQVSRLSLDGSESADNRIALVDDRQEHFVELELG